MPKIVVYQTAPVWFVKNEYFMAKIDVCRSLLPNNRVIGWDIEMTSHPISNASFINIWDRLIWRRSPNLTRSLKLAAAPNWPGRGPTVLRARVRNQGRLENRSHLVPKTGFQDGGDRTRIFTHKIIIMAFDMIYQFLGMEAKNYEFGMFCQQCHPSVASGDADIRLRNALPDSHMPFV